MSKYMLDFYPPVFHIWKPRQDVKSEVIDTHVNYDMFRDGINGVAGRFAIYYPSLAFDWVLSSAKAMGCGDHKS